MPGTEPTRLVDLVDEARVRSIGTRLADRAASFGVEAFVAATISAGWESMSFTQKTARVTEWTADPDPRVRRLVSEGTRPRLPWAGRLRLPVEPVLAILSRLRADPAKTVRRSVANHLNDLAKDHDAQVVDPLSTWFA